MFSILFTIIFSVGYWFQHGTEETVTITVKDKQRITTGTKSKYIIFGEKESFENTDSFFHSKYNSSDIYKQFQKGCTYEVSVYGWRVPYLSAYRNIVTILKEEPCS